MAHPKSARTGRNDDWGVSQQMTEESKAIWAKFDENNGIRIATGEKMNVSRKEEEKDENTSMSTITERGHTDQLESSSFAQTIRRRDLNVWHDRTIHGPA
jgi:hypothetical protein